MDKSRILTTVVSAISTLAQSHPVLPRWVQDVYGDDPMTAAAAPLLGPTSSKRPRTSSQEVVIHIQADVNGKAASNLRR
jgi:hypothetical protein